MHKLIFALCFVVVLGVAAPLSAEAQLRDEVRVDRTPQLYDQDTSGTLLNRLFSPEVFQMNHSYEMSMGSFGGDTHSLGMYTNTMMFDFSEQWSARVDVSAAFSPFNNNTSFGQDQNNMQIFLRNAEVTYQPNENTQFSIQIRQSPHGAYASPYGHYGPYSGMHHAAFDRWSP